MSRSCQHATGSTCRITPALKRWESLHLQRSTRLVQITTRTLYCRIHVLTGFTVPMWDYLRSRMQQMETAVMGLKSVVVQIVFAFVETMISRKFIDHDVLHIHQGIHKEAHAPDPIRCIEQQQNVIHSSCERRETAFTSGCRSNPNGCEHGPSHHKPQHRWPCSRCPPRHCTAGEPGRSGPRPWRKEQQQSGRKESGTSASKNALSE